MTLEPFWASSRHGDSGPHLDVPWTRCFLYPSRTQSDLVTVILNWASPGPSEYAPSGPHLDLVTLFPTWASSGHGSIAWPAGWPHLDLVTLVPTWASSGHVPLHGLQVGSPGPENSSPYLGIIGTWFLCMACRLASSGPGERGCHLGLTHAW